MEILWDLPKQEVLQILEEFHKKSLIVKKYNATLKCNVYGIHDLLLYHLKDKMLDKDALEVCNNYFYLNIFQDISQLYLQPFSLKVNLQRMLFLRKYRFKILASELHTAVHLLNP